MLRFLQLRRQLVFFKGYANKQYKDNNEDADFKECQICNFKCNKNYQQLLRNICIIPTTMITIDLLFVHLHSHYSTLSV